MMQELIERLEKTEGSDRALADDVLRAAGWRWEYREFDLDGVICGRDFITKPDGTFWNSIDGPRPDPTASIDAALTLVPESDCDRELYWGNLAPCMAQIEGPPGRFHIGRHTSPAIALCIAALRARAAISDHQSHDRPAPSGQLSKAD